MKYVNVDPNEILENRFTGEDAKLYLRNLGPAFGFVWGLSVLNIVLRVVSGRDLNRVLFLTGALFVMTVLCVAMLVSTRVKNNKRLKTVVDKYGRDTLEMDLRDPDNEVFMLHQEKYETYIIVSSRYLYFAREAIFALDDIRNVYIDMSDNTSQTKAGESNARPYDHSRKSMKEILRFCKPAYITTMDGQTQRFLVALDEEQMKQLSEIFATLNK